MVMFDFFKQLFFKPQKLVIIDPDFGEISYSDGSWIMQGRWQILEKKAHIRCIDIPGDEYGPTVKSRKFLITKKHSLDELWTLFSPELIKILAQNDLQKNDRDPKQILYIESLAGGSEQDWEVAFQSDCDYGENWIHISIAMENGKRNIIVTR